MDFTRNERIAMVSLLHTVCMIDENSTAIAQKRIKLVKDYLNWSEVEEKADNIGTDKVCEILSKMSDTKKLYFCSMAIWITHADDNMSKEESAFVTSVFNICQIPKLPEGKLEEILEDIMETVKNPKPKESKSAVYYQKQFQADYQLNYGSDFWDGIIPESAEEMAGALLFCKQHFYEKHTTYPSKTLSRLVEMCKMEYADAPEVQKVLPGVLQLIENEKEADRKAAEKKKRQTTATIIVWCVFIVLVIIQVIIWGWWTILSGIGTAIIAGIVTLIIHKEKLDL